MFVVDLVCAAGHLFEGWYDHHQAFAEARDGGELACPACGSGEVTQRLGFRGIVMRGSSSSSSSAPAAASSSSSMTPAGPSSTSPPPPLPLEVQRALSKLWRVVRAHAEDVGDAFAPTALAMHRGDEEARPIHGTSTPDEARALLEEGVAYVAVPVPDIDHN